MAKVNGLGGVFLRARDPKVLTQWYAEHLGLPTNAWGGMEMPPPDSDPGIMLQFFPLAAKNFGTGPQQVMFNLRVDNMDELLAKLEAAGVSIDPDRQSAEYGHFAWINDPEGNRIELWQPL